MPSPSTTNILTYSLLTAAAGFAILLPADLGPRSGHAKPESGPTTTSVRLNGVIRDFRRTNAYFTAAPSGGNGHYAGNVALGLGANDRPVYAGTGYRVSTQWRDKDAHPIAPHLYTDPKAVRVKTAPTIDKNAFFDTWNSSKGPYNAVSNVGPAPAIATAVSMPSITPPTMAPSTGVALYKLICTLSTDLHCDSFSTNAKTTLSISGHRTILCEGSFLVGQQTQILILPNSSLRLYVKGQININQASQVNMNTFDPNKVTIYNLGTSTVEINQSNAVCARIISPNAGMHLAQSDHFYGSFVGTTMKLDQSAGFHHDASPITDACGSLINDAAGAFGAASNAGLVSAARFAEWYIDTMGTNLSMQHAIDLTLSSDSVYEYLNDDFHPCDGLLFGNEGQSHNNYFTYAVDASFTHHACDQRFFEFQGCDDAWLFVNGQLMMDLGGIVPGTSQYVDFNRLDLTDGNTYTLNFFYAQRNPNLSVFRMRTNLDLQVTAESQVVSGGWD